MKLFGLIGRPVTSSVGQIIYNRIFAEYDVDTAYVSMDIHPLVLEQTVMKMTEHFSGFNVTIPHKISVMQIVDHLDASALDTQNVNLVTVNDGETTGYNTDFLSLLELMKSKKRKDGISNAIIYGSGGTCRTSLAALRELYGPDVINVVSRNPEEAEKKLENMKRDDLHIISFDDLAALKNIDAVFNCSPFGMQDFEKNTLKLPHSVLEDPLVVDFVYVPVETELVKWGRYHSSNTIGGDDIYIGQALHTFRYALNLDIARKDVRKQFEAAISEVS